MWGDILFLPIFNGVVVEYGIVFSLSKLLIATAIGALLTVSFIHWRKNIAVHNDWSRPKKGRFNFGGWYHASYMFIQASFIFYSFMIHFDKTWPYILFILYLTPLILRFMELGKKGHLRKNIKNY